MEVALVNPDPLTVNKNDGPPATALLGWRLLIVRGGALIVNTRGGGVFCPDCKTLTLAVPGLAMRLAEIIAVSCPELTKVVFSARPFQVICVAPVNPDPFSVSRNAGPPATALFGTRLV